MPKIIYHDSDGVDKTFVLNREVLLVGRATECQIQTLDAMVSRRHARIFWDGGYWIEDLGSSNGVYVGSQKVDRAPFNAGDVVVCGSLVLRLEAEAGMDVAAPAPAFTPPVAAPAPAPAPIVAAVAAPAPAPTPSYEPPPPQPAAQPASFSQLDRTPAPDQGFARNVEPSQVIEVIQPPSPPQPRSTNPGFADAAPPAVVAAPPVAGLSADALQAEVERSGRLAAEAERDELRRQLDSAKIKAAADLRRQLDLEGEVEKAKQQAAPAPDPAQAAELENLRSKVSVLESELKKADAVADELDAVRAKLQRAESEMGSVAAAGTEQLQKAETERDELRRRVAQLAEEASQTKRAADDERDQLEQKIAKLEESLRGQAEVGTKASELTTERDTLRAELEKAKGAEVERDELRRRVAQLAEEASQTKRAADDERDTLERKVTALEEAAKSAGGQAEEVAQLKTRFATLEGDLAHLTTERDELKKRAAQVAEESQTKIRAFETMRDELELKVANLESKLAAAEGERAALQGRVAGLEKDLQSSGSAATETNQLRGELNAAQAQLKNLEADRNAFKAAADDLRQKVADLEEAARQAQSTPGAAALETELENVKIELAVAKAAAGEKEALQQKVTAYERELRQADATADELDRLKAEYGKLKQALADAQASGAAAPAGAPDAALQQKLDDAQAKAASFERELGDLRGKLAAAEKRAQDAAAAAAAAPKPAAGGGAVDPAANDTLTSLSDALAELRLALRSANDESTMLAEPKPSVTLVIDSLTAATDHLENARAQVRTLSQLLGVG